MTEHQYGHDHQVGHDGQVDHDNHQLKKEEQVTPSSVSPECPGNFFAPNQQCSPRQEIRQEEQPTSPVTSIERRNRTGTERQQRDNPAIGSAVQNVRTTISTESAVALDHVIADLRISKVEAVRDAIGLYLRYHGRGQGVPEPIATLTHKDNGKESIK
jgi:hypothetical protein